MVKKVSEDDAEGALATIHMVYELILELGFRSGASATIKTGTGMRRTGTIIRTPLDRKERKEQSDGELRSADVCVYLTDSTLYFVLTRPAGFWHCTGADC